MRKKELRRFLTVLVAAFLALKLSAQFSAEEDFHETETKNTVSISTEIDSRSENTSPVEPGDEQGLASEGEPGGISAQDAPSSVGSASQSPDASLEELLGRLRALPEADEVSAYTREEKDRVCRQVQEIVAVIQGLSSFPEPDQEAFYAVYEGEGLMEKLFALNTVLAGESSIQTFATANYKVGGVMYKLFYNQSGRDDCTAIVAEHGDNKILSGNVTIPATINVSGVSGFPGGVYTITGIEHDAFYYNSRITGITLPDSPFFTVIGEYAFAYCSNLQGGLTLPTSLVTIEGYAFLNCSKLTGPLILPASLVSVGDFSFRGCSGFSGELTIPPTLTTMGKNAFLETDFSRINHEKLISLNTEMQVKLEIKRPDYEADGYGGFEDSSLLLDTDDTLFYKAARWTDASLTEAEIAIDYAQGSPYILDVLFVLDYSNSMLLVDSPSEGYIYPRSFVLEDLVLDAIECLLTPNHLEGYDVRVGLTAFGTPGYGWKVDFDSDTVYLQEELLDHPLIKGNVTSYTDGLQEAIDMIEARSEGTRPCKIIFVSDGFPSDMNGTAGVAPGQPGIYDGAAEAQKLREYGFPVIPLGIFMSDLTSPEALARAELFFRNISFDNHTYFMAGTAFEFRDVWCDILTRKLFIIDTVITDTLGELFAFGSDILEQDITASAGTVTWDTTTGTVTWDLHRAMVWEVHTLTIKIRLKSGNLKSSGRLPTNSLLTSSNDEIAAEPGDDPSGSPFLIRHIVEHIFISGTPEKELPGAISPSLLPPYKGGFRNGAEVVPTGYYGGHSFLPGIEIVVGEDIWHFAGWDKSSAVIENENVLFTGIWKIKGALVRVKKMVEGGGDSGDIFLIHLKRMTGTILGSVALQAGQTGGWMNIDMEGQPVQRIEISEVIPMEYSKYYDVTLENGSKSKAELDNEGFLLIHPGDEVTVIVTNTFKHSGFFKAKDWVRNIFTALT